MTLLIQILKGSEQVIGKWIVNLLIGVLFISQTAYAETTYVQLRSTVMDRLPEKASLEALSELKSGYADASDSWLANDVYLNLAVEDDQFTGDQGYQSWEAGAGFAINMPSQREAGSGLTESSLVLQTATQHYVQWLAENKVRDLVWSLKTAQTRWHFQNQSYQQTQQLVAAVKQAYEAGEKPKIDWLLAQKSLKQIEQQLQQSQANLQTVQKEYLYWTDANELPTALIESASASQQRSAISVAQHPQLAMLQAKSNWVKAQSQLMRRQQSGHPEIYLGTKSERDDQTSANQYVIAQLSIPLGLNPASKKQVAEINQQLSERNIELYSAKQSLETALQKTVSELQASKKMLAIAREKIALSRQTFELSEQSYQEGNTHIQNLLLIRQAYFEDQLNAELAIISVHQKEAQLNQILGVSLP